MHTYQHYPIALSIFYPNFIWVIHKSFASTAPRALSCFPSTFRVNSVQRVPYDRSMSTANALRTPSANFCVQLQLLRCQDSSDCPKIDRNGGNSRLWNMIEPRTNFGCLSKNQKGVGGTVVMKLCPLKTSRRDLNSTQRDFHTDSHQQEALQYLK
jgi:hypothetical protein